MILRCAALLAVLLAAPLAAADDYSIAYVRMPRTASVRPDFPEVRDIGTIDTGAEMVLREPNGTERVLYRHPGGWSVMDPSTSLDGLSILFSLVHDPSLRHPEGRVPLNGISIHRVVVATGEVTEVVPVGDYEMANPTDPKPRFKPMHTGPQELPGGKLAFTSNRFGHRPPKVGTFPTMQIFVRFPSGEIEPIAPMTISSALHPTLMLDGRLMFSSSESQGLRDNRVWGLWAINPDGRGWGPILSAFANDNAPHFQAQLADGTVAIVDYYNLNNFGFGLLLGIPPPPASGPAFHSAFERPPIVTSQLALTPARPHSFAFAPRGIRSLTPWTHQMDSAAHCPPGQTACAPADRVGKVSHPSAAPANKLLLSYAKGPVNVLARPVNQPWPDSGIYRTPAGGLTASPAELELVVNSTTYNEFQPVAVVSWEEKYGRAPVDLPWLPQGAHPSLPPGTPFGIIATGSLYNRESAPGVGVAAYGGLDPHNTAANGSFSNWLLQGGDARLFQNSEIAALRVLALEPGIEGDPILRPRIGGPGGINERTRILGDCPKLSDGSTPPCVVPADHPFKFQLVDAKGRTLVDAQTWHQVRPGETRYDCGGCHAHSSTPVRYEDTIGFQAAPIYLTGPARSPTWVRDVAPLVDRIQGTILGVALGDLTSEAAFKCIAEDRVGTCVPSKLASREWRHANASAYVRFSSPDRSLLSWAANGGRSDGWTDATFPDTGDMADINYAPATWTWALSPTEKRVIDEWIGIGAPYGGPAWDRDTARPVVTVEEPRGGAVAEMPRILYGAADANSGLASVSVVASWDVRGNAPGTDLSSLAVGQADGVWAIDLIDEGCPAPGGCVQQSPPITAGVVVVEGRDGHGNRRRIERRFQLAAQATATPAPTMAPTVPIPPTPLPATPTATATPTPSCVWRGPVDGSRIDLTRECAP